MRRNTKSNIALATAGIFSGFAIAGLTSSIEGSIKYDKLSSEYNDMLSGISVSQVYIEHKKQHSETLYQMYKNGEISASEYNTKLNILNSTEYIYDNRELLVDDVKAYQMQKNQEEQDQQMSRLSFGSGSLIFGGIIASCGMGIHLNMKKEDERGMVSD